MRHALASPSFRRRVTFAFASYFVLISSLHACLWDWDTLQMERRRFPGVLELITGKFVRHSRDYYEWRIQDRRERFYTPAENPELADDIAVAQAKLGRYAEAISLLEQVVETHPDRYETLSNLGTIRMLAGDLKAGKQDIDRAITINPDAHFGRERYQSLLADYFLNAHPAQHPLSTHVETLHLHDHYVGFAKFILEKQPQQGRALTPDETRLEMESALKGVLGMMHFANYDSPLLLEALGDLLVSGETSQLDATQLGARAYYRISELSKEQATRDEFKQVARNTIWGHHDYINYRGDSEKGHQRDELEKLSAGLQQELAAGQTYFDAIANDEKAWIREGINVDKAFAKKYYESLEATVDLAKDQLAQERNDARDHPQVEMMRRAWRVLGVVLTVTIVGLVITLRYRRSKQLKPGREH